MAVSASHPRIGPSSRPAGVPSWKHVFFTGLVLWFASVLVTGLTGNLTMIPTVILLGSFLVPATAVVWYLDHYQSEELSPWRVMSAFLVGGTVGVHGLSTSVRPAIQPAATRLISIHSAACLTHAVNDRAGSSG